jgi:transposase
MRRQARAQPEIVSTQGISLQFINLNSNPHMPLRIYYPVCLGLDIAKAKIDACLESDSAQHQISVENSSAGCKKLLRWLRKLCPQSVPVVMEATGTYGDLAAAFFHENGYWVSVINPRWIKDYGRSEGRRNKTDQQDARLIAAYGRTHLLDRWLPAAPEVAELRALVRRLNTVEELIQGEARRQEIAPAIATLRKSLGRVAKALKAEQQLLEKAIRAHLAAHPSLAADCARLQAIEGIGAKTARALVAELPRHLPGSRAAAAWVGVTPRRHESGTSIHKPSRIGREGNQQLRRALYMPAVVARSRNPRMKAFADRLELAGKSKLAAVIAVLHKLVRISFAMLKNNSSYDPNHHPQPSLPTR